MTKELALHRLRDEDRKPVYLLGPDGEPIIPKLQDDARVKSGYGIFLRNLAAYNAPAIVKARDPYATHSWVYACATAIALNLSQVDLQIMRETEAVQGARAKAAVRAGRWKHGESTWTGNRGKLRSALRRHLRSKARFMGRQVKTLEPDFENTFWTLLDRPNNMMTSANELVYAIVLHLSVRGEAFLLPITPSGTPWIPGDEADKLIVLHPENVKEKLNPDGTLDSWEYWPNSRDAGSTLGQRRVWYFLPQELMQFKYFNPSNPLRGMSRITAAATGVYQDLAAQHVTTSLLENDAEPGGFLHSKVNLRKEEKDELLAKFEDRHKGPLNRRKTGVLEGDIEFVQTAFSPKDMEYIEQRKWTREEVLAVMGVPKSILSVDENLNYSIQLSQDKNFWNKTLLPIVRKIEAVIDQTLLFAEPDSIVAAFDLSTVEALQEDLSAKVTTAVIMVKDGRVAPQDAYDAVGVDLPPQEHDDVILVNPLLAPIDDVVSGVVNEPLQPVPGDPNADPNADTNNPDNPAPDNPPPKKPPPKKPAKLADPMAAFKRSAVVPFVARRATSTVAWSILAARRKGVTATAYRRLIAASEKPVKLKWKSYVQGLRREQLDLFNKWIEEHGITEATIKARITEADIERFLFDAGKSKKALKGKLKAEYNRMADSVAEFTTAELNGVYVFDIDNPKVLDFIDGRANKVTGITDTIRKRLDNSLRRGIKDGESLGDMRSRINRVFNNQISASRATTIARTETAQTFGGVRDIIFGDEGVSKQLWTTAGDEHVREDHQTIGAAGEQGRGFNFMELLGRGDESLLFPSDPNGPADEVINCRCVAIATG